MPTATKRVVRPGQFRQANGKIATISKQDLIDWKSKHDHLRQNGFYVPLPVEHDASVMPTTTKPPRHADKMWVGEDDWLYSQFEADTEAEAAKIAGSDVSIASFTELPLPTGKLENFIGHVALTANPACKNQGPALLNQPQITMSLSSAMMLDSSGGQTIVNDDDKGKAATLENALSILQDLGIPLPADTTDMNIVERLVTAGQAVLAHKSNTEGEDVTKAPPGATVQKPSPIAMSQPNDPFLVFALSKLQAGQVRDAHGRLYTAETLSQEFATQGQAPAGQPVVQPFNPVVPAAPNVVAPQPQANLAALAGMAQQPAHQPTGQPPAADPNVMLSRAQKAVDVKSRIEACVQTGKISPQVATEQGQPLLTNIHMALSSGEETLMAQSLSAAESVLAAWESISPQSTLALSNGNQVNLSATGGHQQQVHPSLQIQPMQMNGAPQDVDYARANEIAKQQLGY